MFIPLDSVSQSYINQPVQIQSTNFAVWMFTLAPRDGDFVLISASSWSDSAGGFMQLLFWIYFRISRDVITT